MWALFGVLFVSGRVEVERFGGPAWSKGTTCRWMAQKAQCTSPPLKYLAIHIHEPARQRARDLVNTPLCEGAKTEKKGGGIVCGTQKSDRSSSLASAEIKVCSRTVLPGRGRAEHQKIGPLPQPRTKITTPSNNLVSSSQETLRCCGTHLHQPPIPHSPFSTPNFATTT